MTALATRATEVAAELVSAQAAFAAAEQEAQAERNAIAGGETLGEISAAQARRKRARIETKLNRMRERVDTLAAAVPELERRVAEEEQKAHTSEVQSAHRRLDHALKVRQSASRNLARDLRQVEHSVAELRRHRGLCDKAAEAYSARLHRGEKFEWPRAAHVDEDWEVSRELAEFLQGGAQRPITDAEEARARERRTREKQDAETLRTFKLMPSEALLRTLSPRLHEQAQAILDQHRALADEQRHEQDERTAKRRLARIGEETRSRPAPVA